MVGLKRKISDISGDPVIDLVELAKRIFVVHYDENHKLYQSGTHNHPKYPDITISPHFIRDDKVIMYIQLSQNKNMILAVSNETIQITMDALNVKETVLVTLKLSKDVNLDKIGTASAAIAECLRGMSTKRIKYKPEKIKQYTLKRQKTDFDPDKWVSASKTRNYALHDTLVDWLDMYHSKAPKFNAKMKDKTFTDFIMNKGNQFEERVVSLIKKKVPSDEFVTVCTNIKDFYDKVSEYEALTIREIKKGTPIIYQGLLMNHDGPLSFSYGLPDLIVRSDYLKCITSTTGEYPVKKRASGLRGPYHYVIVDIKFTTLELCSDGERIRNSSSIPAYKCQLYIYNKALAHIQGYDPGVSFIMGRKYKYESKGTLYCGRGCFDRLGQIQYKNWDASYVTEAANGVNWIKKLRTDGKKWKLLPEPSVPELYPNMSSASETCWDNIKSEYAKKIGEITVLWNCGVKNRNIAHDNGIYSYKDPKCSPVTVGINGPKQGPVLDAIIKINQRVKFNSALDRIHLTLNENVDNRWAERSNLTISVDFETINSVFDDFNQLPIANDQNYLFMIGVSYKVAGKPAEYQMFLASKLSKDVEFQMIYQFYKFLRHITDKYLGKRSAIPAIYHWGAIERTFFHGLCDRLTVIHDANDRGRTTASHGRAVEDLKMLENGLEWFDLCECFKNNPIVINGCFKFGLKEIVGRLEELGLIKSKWDSGKNACTGGTSAMVMAEKAYREVAETGNSIKEHRSMKEIVKYNKIDCMSIHEIIHVLRKKANVV